MPRELWPMVAEHWSQPKSFLGMAAYFEALPECAREIIESPPLEEIPVIILTPAGALPLTVAGRNVRHIAAETSGHWIQLDQPGLVVEAVRTLAAQTQPDRV